MMLTLLSPDHHTHPATKTRTSDDQDNHILESGSANDIQLT
jgi:hypothetical protein